MSGAFGCCAFPRRLHVIARCLDSTLSLTLSAREPAEGCARPRPNSHALSRPSGTQHAWWWFDAPDGPHVTLVVVRLALAQLRAEVVGRAHGALSKVRLTAHHLAEAKVAQLHLQCRTMLTYIRQGLGPQPTDPSRREPLPMPGNRRLCPPSCLRPAGRIGLQWDVLTWSFLVMKMFFVFRSRCRIFLLCR